MKLLVSLFCLALLTSNLVAQEVNKERRTKHQRLRKVDQKDSTTNCIIVDALNCCDGKNTKPKSIQENSVLAIRVINVNPYRTTLSATGKTSQIDFGNDSLFTLAFAKPESKEKSTDTDTIDGSPVHKTASSKCCHEMDSIRNSMKKDEIAKIMQQCVYTFKLVADSLNALYRSEIQLRKLFDTSFISKSGFIKSMWGILNCTGISSSDSCCNCSAHKLYTRLYNSLGESYTCIKKNYTALSPERTKGKNFTLSGSLKDEINGLTVTVKNSPGVLTSKAEEHPFKDLFERITSVMQKITSDSVRNALLLSAEYIDNSIGKLCYDSGKQFEQQNYITSIIEGDYITVTPFVKNYKGDTIHLKDFPTYRIRIYGGHRANVSTGISFAFGGLIDDDFFIKKTDSVSTKFTINKTSKKLSNQYIPSLATFLHIYNRNKGKNNFQSTATLGLSANPTSLESLRVMAGYSLIFGEEKRGVISIGVIGGSVSKLNPHYDENKAYLYADYEGLQETDLINKKFKLGWFFGLSYNLSKKR